MSERESHLITRPYTSGYLVAVEHHDEANSPVPAKKIEEILQFALAEVGFNVRVDVEGMGNIDCYEVDVDVDDAIQTEVTPG